jgi:hypothetical protein
VGGVSVWADLREALSLGRRSDNTAVKVTKKAEVGLYLAEMLVCAALLG